jgi:hypothetical protein
MPGVMTRHTLAGQWELLKLLPGRGAGKMDVLGSFNRDLINGGFSIIPDGTHFSQAG